jgi:hypothetical protein
LFGYLFEGRPIDKVHEALRAHRNPDSGWGHGMEPDIKTPESHVLALEFALTVVVRDMQMSPGDLFTGAAGWMEQHYDHEKTKMRNPASVLEYPHAPFWVDLGGGQTAPDSITGHLTKIGMSSPGLAALARDYAEKHLTLDRIAANDWQFMAYHAHDYYMHTPDFPDVEKYRVAVIENIRACAQNAPEAQYFQFFSFAPTPDAPVAQAMPDIVSRNLDYLAEAQRDDGHWDDEHGLTHWWPYTTILALRALTRHGRVRIVSAA